MSDLLDVLISRASKEIIEQLKDEKVTLKQIESTLEKRIYNKVKSKKRSKGHKLVRVATYISDSSDDNE